MIGGAFHLCGAAGGRIVKVPSYDGRGAFESAEMRNTLTEPLLRAVGADPRGQFPLPSIERCRALAPLLESGWRAKATRILRGLGRVSFYASAHSCLCWPVWAAAMPDALWVVVRRKPEEIVRACMQTGYMNAYGSAVGWRHWVEAHEEHFAAMRNAGLRLVEVWPEKLLKCDTSELHNAVVMAGLQWRPEAIAEYVGGEHAARN
jgi:hypothetical protein